MSEVKTIFHIDVNSAFLSWTAIKELKEHPGSVDLRTVPSVIGGDRETRHGIVTAKSIPAKKYGIVTAMPVAKALELCPNLVIAKGDFQWYRQNSHAFIDILRSYTYLVEQASIDEAYVDVTELEQQWQGKAVSVSPEDVAENPQLKRFFSKRDDRPHNGGGGISGPMTNDSTATTNRMPNGASADGTFAVTQFPINIAFAIKNRVRQELGFTVNVGVAHNKLLAKMASDFRKPDRIHTLYEEEVPTKMWPLPIGELFGCGKKTAAKLMGLGTNTIGEVAALPLTTLTSILGEKGGEYIYFAANGVGGDTVHTEREDAKSYSNEITTSFDITLENYDRQMPALLDKLAEKVAGRLQKDSVYVGNVGVMVKTSLFTRRSMQTKLPDPTNRKEVILATATRLMEKLLRGEKGLLMEQEIGIRLVGISTADISDGSYMQMNLMDLLAQKEEEEKLREQELARQMARAAEEEERKAEEEARRAQEEAAAKKRAKLLAMTQSIQSRYGKGAVFKGNGEIPE